MQPLVLCVRSFFFTVGALEVYLARYPDVRIHCAIQDHMPGALQKLSTYHLVFGWGQAYLREH